ncbi:hypothetical protein VEx25_1434 [Vibrio antiquarius]|uniref:Uncharacterized protein n=1 Tax=Vibrio antiquarius (strain Ex25) TaxID=150340 RepID=A0ABM9WX00_VIBAE|nr:hypothetical protein VEx25_1434 [Vibrio antiquarius]
MTIYTAILNQIGSALCRKCIKKCWVFWKLACLCE